MIEYPPFFYGEFIDPNLCDSIVKWFDDLPIEQRLFVDRPEKQSTDVNLTGEDKISADYDAALTTVAQNYQALYPRSLTGVDWGHSKNPQVQKYLPGQGYKLLHCENTGQSWVPEDSIDQDASTHKLPISRHLVYMTYLNDVEDGGTVFPYQDFECPAKKGLTLIWPAPWMFPHKGIVSYTKTKYIVTGWFSFYGKQS